MAASDPANWQNEAGQAAHDIVPCLRHLGFRADEARRAAAYCETIPEASLEERVRAALALLKPPARTIAAHAAG